MNKLINNYLENLLINITKILKTLNSNYTKTET